MLTQEQESTVERQQYFVLRNIVYVFTYSNRDLLELSGLLTLKERREEVCLKFARMAQLLINLEIPVLVRSLKSSNVELG